MREKKTYLKISNYLQESDVFHPHTLSKGKFKFFVNENWDFVVQQSLACFLSPKVQECLSNNIQEFKINITGPSVDPPLIIESLKGLLSGKAINIDGTNFSTFENVFSALGNTDFKDFFGDSSPSTTQEFYLSVNSLKNVPDDILDENIYSPSHLHGFSIPVGLIHLFWRDPVDISSKVISKNFSNQQILEYVSVLNQMKHGIFTGVDSANLGFFDFIKLHHKLLKHATRLSIPFSSFDKTLFSTSPHHRTKNSLISTPPAIFQSPQFVRTQISPLQSNRHVRRSSHSSIKPKPDFERLSPKNQVTLDFSTSESGKKKTKRRSYEDNKEKNQLNELMKEKDSIIQNLEKKLNDFTKEKNSTITKLEKQLIDLSSEKDSIINNLQNQLIDLSKKFQSDSSNFQLTQLVSNEQFSEIQYENKLLKQQNEELKNTLGIITIEKNQLFENVEYLKEKFKNELIHEQTILIPSITEILNEKNNLQKQMGDLTFAHDKATQKLKMNESLINNLKSLVDALNSQIEVEKQSKKNISTNFLQVGKKVKSFCNDLKTQLGTLTSDVDQSKQQFHLEKIEILQQLSKSHEVKIRNGDEITENE